MDIFKYGTFKIFHHSFSQAIANHLKQYILDIMVREKLKTNYNGWYIGITDDPQLSKGKNFNTWQCVNNKEALDTKLYFTNRGDMKSDPQTIQSGTILYVYR